MDEGDAGQGTASSQEIGGETGAVIDVKSLGDSVGQEGLLKNDREGADRLRGAEGMADHHAGVIIDDGAEDGLGHAVRVIRGTDLGAVHEVRDPEVIDVVHFVGFAHIGAILYAKPSLLFDHPEQGVIVNRRVPQQILIPKRFIELLHREGGMGLAFELNDLERLRVKTSGSAPIGAAFGLEGVKAPFAVLSEPGLHRGNTDLPQTVAGELVLGLGLFPEVLVLGPCGFGQHGTDELIPFEGNLFSGLFFHRFFLLCRVLGHRRSITASENLS